MTCIGYDHCVCTWTVAYSTTVSMNMNGMNTVYTCTYMHMYMYMHVQWHMHVYISVCVHVCLRVSLCVSVSVPHSLSSNTVRHDRACL